MKKEEKKKLDKVSGGWVKEITPEGQSEVVAEPGEQIKVTKYACLTGNCVNVDRVN